MKRILSLSVLAALAASVLFIACPSQKRNIKIGAILPLTGDAAVYGQRLREGIEIAIQEWKDANPQQPVVVDFQDSRMDPKEAVNAVNGLIQRGFRLILGPYSSSELLAVAPICEKKQTLVLSPGASSPKVTEAGDYVFRIVASDIYDAGVMATYARRELKATKAAIVYINNDYGVGVAKSFDSRFTSLGGTVVYSDAFEPGMTDFRAYLDKTRKAAPDVVILIGVKEMGYFLRQMRELGLSFKVVSSGLFENPDIVSIAGKAAEGVLYTMPYFDVSGSDSVVTRFHRQFDAMYPGKQPSIEHALGYDATRVLLNAIKVAGQLPGQVRDALYKTRDFPGVAGSMTFDANGDVSKPYGIKVYKGGQFQWLIPVYKMD